ncbi:hypothetical protein HYX01_00205 [Candidatus Woesearchaeota archaeon]|nr:hypothetical protein [Candidatus Woesearchaeota archaeon]
MVNQKLIFEVIPPIKTASESYISKLIGRIVDAVNKIKQINIINIPEIVDENHVGKPYYRNVDTRKFGAILRDKCKKDMIVNTVVVHHEPKNRFEEWLEESINDYGIKNYVFVGAKINTINYPGPSIAEANSIARKKGINFGNIFIPNRENEAERLINKTLHGCNFFTSQVLFEADSAIDVLKEYIQKCDERNINPSRVYLSFAPLSSVEDIHFIKWLGAEISEKTEKKLKNRDIEYIGSASINHIKEVAQKIFNGSFNKKLSLGLNIEYVMLHNLELSKELISGLLDLKLS